MKCITICQPYASAFFIHPAPLRKRVENRSWPLSYRGPLLIHAGKSRSWMQDTPVHPALRGVELPFGAIIGLVEMVDCLRIGAYLVKYGEDCWANGPWCHVYAAPKLFERPIPYRGSQGLFEVPDSILEAAHADQA